MANSCCILSVAARPLDNEYVSKVYIDPKVEQYHCSVCGDDTSEILAKRILTTLREQATTLSFADVIRLRAAFWSLLGHYHGTNDFTSFYIVEVAESVSGILATVHTEHGQRRELAASKADFLKMVEDPFSSGEHDENQLWADLTAPNIGKAPRSHSAPMMLKEIPCWCCDTKIRELVMES